MKEYLTIDRVNELLCKRATVLFLLASFLALEIYRGFILQSLWLDETISAWITDGTALETWKRALEYQGQSPFYYEILWAWRQLFGASELALRVPSIFAVVASCVIFSEMLRRVSPVGATVGAVLFITADPIQRAMCARPYALALLFVVGASYELERFLRDGNNRLSAYFCSLVLAFYSHYLALSVLLVHVPLALIRANRVQQGRYLVGLGGALIATLGGVSQLLSLGERSATLAFAPVPDVRALLSNVFPTDLATYFLVGMGLATVLFLGRGLSLTGGSDLRRRVSAYLLWGSSGPLAFWIWSVVSARSLFVPRYFTWHFPGLIGAVALAVGALRPSRAAATAGFVVIALVLFRESQRLWVIEDWKGAAALVQERVKNDAAQVFFYAGLAEVDANPEWASDRSRGQYLTAPFRHYAPAIETIPVASVDAPLKSSETGKFIVYLNRRSKIGDKESPMTAEMIGGAARQAGIRLTELPVKGSVHVAQIE